MFLAGIGIVFLMKPYVRVELQTHFEALLQTLIGVVDIVWNLQMFFQLISCINPSRDPIMSLQCLLCEGHALSAGYTLCPKPCKSQVERHTVS